MLISKFGRRTVFIYGRIGALMMLALLTTVAFYSTSSASFGKHKAGSIRVVAGAVDPLGVIMTPGRLGAFSPLLMPQDPPPPETIATYDATCTTAKTAFNLNETVCLKTAGAPVSSPPLRSVTWSNPASFEVQRTDLVSSPDDTFTLPASQTSVIDGVVIDNRGTWTVKVVLAGRSKVRASATFTVNDPENPAFDLNVYSAADTSEGNVSAGSNLSVVTAVTNFGPNDAANVELVQAVPSNATFVSGTQTGGSSTFTCMNPAPGGLGTSNCTITGLPKGGSAEFTFVYLVSAGAPKGTLINSLATLSPNTTVAGELHTPDNSWTARAIVTDNPNAQTCAIGCPANRTVTATSSNGAIVNFTGDIESFGDCGTVTASPASGSLFPVGTTPVSVTSAQGASCNFAITVVDTPAPTITCAADQTAQATGTQTETSVNVNAPTADGTNVNITGVRSDNRNVSDPYPVGTTTITWTATECLDAPDCADPSARSASCTQHIIVTSADAPTISCPTDKSFNASGCDITLTAAQIGASTATGINVVVTSRRSDDLALTDPFPAGLTTITWSATDDADRVVSCTQRITITTNGSDTTPPTLTIPPDLNVTTTTCSATLDDELGVASATDNCSSSVNITRTGVPTVACPIPGDPNRQCETFVFPTGTTNVVYTATDAAGNSTTLTQHVTVHESPDIPPTFTFVPGPLTFYTGPGATSCGTFIGDATLGTATADDNCPGVTVARSGVPSGNNFPVGNTLVTYTATDASGNTATATQTVTVVDNSPPTVTPPAAVTLFTGPGAASCGITIANLDATLGTGSAGDNCSGVGPVTRSGVPAGAVFPLGQTTLTYSATDVHGNTTSANQVVTVVDNTPPTISCLADIIVDFNAAVNGAVVTYAAPVGVDNCVATTTQIAGLPSGATFPVGTTTNTFRVTDAAGSTAECSFKVTVALTSIIGLDSVSISGMGFVDSYDSTGGYPATKGSLGNILSNGTITLATSGNVFGNVRSTRAGVAMSGASQVTGNATAGTTVSRSGSATVGGTITNNLLAPLMTLPSVPACGAPYSSNSGISGTYSYSQNTGDLSLTGVNIATLSNGTYCFHNVTLSNSAQIKVNGPVVIRMTGTLNASGATSLTNTTGIPGNLRILSSYGGTNGVTLSNGSNAYLMVFAPNTAVTISGAAPLFGTVAAKTVTISNSGMIHYDTRLKSIWPDIWSLILGP
jgi:uncharacterized repeat protein (TIGR01451 family)